MKFDIVRFKDLMTYTMQNFKALESELYAYRMVFHAIKITDRDQWALLETAFQQALTSADLRHMMHEKYDVAVEKQLKLVDEAVLENNLLEWLKKWKPEDPAN